MGESPDSDGTAIQGFHPVHRVAQSYLGSLWIALDKREGEPGKPALLRQLQLPGNTPLEARQGIARAARDALELRHPNVLSVLEVLEQGDSLVIAYEHAEAEPLRSLQSWANLRGLSFPVGVTLKIVSDLLRGLEATHASGGPAVSSPFGGLSPDSVLVSRSGETRLCDPLIASCATLLEGVGFNTAKLAYAAPEQVHAVAPLTPPSDVFTCGAILWELLAARRLLSGSRVAIERKLLEHNLPSLSSNLRTDHQVPSGLLDLVDRALSGDAAKRPQTAAALREELERCGHEVASLEQVAQFVGKLSGQRFDRRSAAVRSKSLPELEAPLEWPVDVPVSNTSARRGVRAGPPTSSAPVESRRTPAERAIQGAAERAIQGAAERAIQGAAERAIQGAAERAIQRDEAPPASSAAPTPPVVARAPESSIATPAARRPVPLPPGAPHSKRTAPTVPNLPASLRPPGPPTHAPPVPAERPASAAAPPTAVSPAAPVVASAPASVRKGPPGLIEPPPIPEQLADEDDDGPTRTDQKPEDWWGAEPFQPAISAAPVKPAISAVPVAKVDLRRTAMGMGAPPPRAPAAEHPVLAPSRPFANLTPEPFASPAAKPPSGPANAGLESLPSLSSAGLPPSSATTPDTALPSSVPATSLGPRPLRLPALEGLDPKFHLVSEELLPRVAPSGRVSHRPRPRSGWARALGFRPGGVGNARALIAGGLACVALAAAVVLVLMLRPKAEAPLGSEPALAAQRAAAAQELPGAIEPEAPSAPNALPDTGVPEPEPAPAPTAATIPPAGAEGATPADFSGIGLDSAKLLDNQLLSLFALERRSTLPSCVEPATARTRGKAKAKAKSKAAKTRDAQAQLKAARKELMRGKSEKAHQLLCAATLRDPTNVAAQQALAELALQLGDPVQAQAAVERALERKPEDPTLLGLLGDTLAVGGDLPGSRRAWLKSAPGKGSEPERLLRLTDTYRKIGDRTLRSSSYAAACTYYRRAVVLSAGNYVPSIGLSEALRWLRQAPAALAWAQRAAHALPEDSRVQVLFGDALYDTGRKDEARLAWQAARDAQPSNAIAARRLAKGKP